MAKVGTVLNVITKDKKGKINENLITYANPNASDENLGKFVVGFNALSEDTLEGIQKVRTDDLILPDDD